MNDEDIAAIRHKLWVYGTEDSLAVLGVIRQLEAERDRLRAEVQALARDALGAGCQAWENNTRAVAAEAERDRLRDALRNIGANSEGWTRDTANEVLHAMYGDAFERLAALKGDTP